MRTPTWVRAALSHPCFTGISRQHLGELIAELANPWTAQHQAALAARRGHRRRRAAGAGPRPRLVFCDRVLATLVVLRLQLPHQALAALYGVDRATITRAVGEVRPLLAARGFAVPGQPELRLKTLADVFAYAQAHGVELRIDGTETQVRRPRAHRVGRRAFVSGKRKQNTSKPTVCSDGQGRTLWAGAVRPGRMHDQTAVKTEGITDLLAQHPGSSSASTRATEGWPVRFPSRSPPRRASRPRTRPPRWSMPTGRPAPSSPQSGSAWSTRSPSTRSGAPCSAGSAAGSPSPRPTWRSPAWSPTGPPAAEHLSRTGQAGTARPLSRTKSLAALSAEGSGITVPGPFCVAPRIRSATVVAASLSMPGMTWP